MKTAHRVSSGARRLRLFAALSGLFAALALALPATSTAAPATTGASAALAGRPTVDVAPHPPGADLRATVSGGDVIYAAGYRCTAAVNVKSGSSYYLLTSGQCTSIGSGWYSDAGRSQYVGPTVGGSFPSNDFGLVAYADSGALPPGTIGDVDVTGAGTPTAGQQVCHRGGTTGVHCGQVTGLNATVDYGGGNVVFGLIRTNICSEPGDLGAPLYAGDKVLGILSGGSGNCTSGGTSYYQPITEALNTYGVSVY